MATSPLHISCSQLKTWLLCPRRYQLQYVQGLAPTFVPVAMAFGAAIHSALAYHFGILKATRTAPPPEEVLEVFRDSWTNASSGPIPLQADEEDDAGNHHVDKGVGMLTAFCKRMADGPAAHVEAVEQPFTVDLHDPDTGEVLEEKLVGFFDLVLREDDATVIVEAKTSARKYSPEQLQFDPQPTAYLFAARELGFPRPRARFLVLTKTKVPAIQIEDLKRDERDLDDLVGTAVAVLRAIDAGVFHRVRGWACRTCGFATACATDSTSRRRTS